MFYKLKAYSGIDLIYSQEIKYECEAQEWIDNYKTKSQIDLITITPVYSYLNSRYGAERILYQRRG